MRFGLLVLAGIVSACGNYDYRYGSAVDGLQSVNSLQAIQANIFQPNCVHCHGPVTKDAGLDLTDYNSLLTAVVPGQPSRSTLYNEVSTGGMPLSGPALSAGEVQAISDWITAGAPNGAFSSNPVITPPPVNPAPAPPPPTPTPPPTPPPSASYAQVQAQVFNKSCTGCHSGNRPSAGVDLSAYGKIMNNSKHLIIAGAATKSLIYTEIHSGAMPPGKNKVSAGNQTLLRDWINQGAKNN